MDREGASRLNVGRPTGSDQPESLGSLVTGIVEDLQGIVRGEIALAKAEMQADVSSLAKGIASLAAGALVVVVGLIFLLLGVTYLINKSLQLWLSAGIVGAVVLVIGIILLLIGRHTLSAANLAPENSIASLKEDQEWANRQIKSVGK